MSGDGLNNIMSDANILAAIAIIDAICDAILEDTNAIREVTDAEPVLEETGGTLTTDGNVQTMYINNAPAGVFRPVCLKIDMTAHTITETVVVRTNYRIIPGGNLIEQDEATFAAAQDPDLKNIDLEPNRYGIQVTIEKTAGTNRAYPWEVFYEVHP